MIINIAKELEKLYREGKIKTKKDIEKYKNILAKKYNLNRTPRNTEIIPYIKIKELKELLKIKETRTISGVAVIAVMTYPFPCPHGKCVMCPGGPEFETPQSYTGKEPAALRAIQHNYDPKEIVKARIKQLEICGHDTSKCEIIVMGGTFPAFPKDYQEFFIKGIYEALCGRECNSLIEAQHYCETCDHRPVGLTIETRPDFCKKEHILNFLYYGATRIEIGVQTVFEDILKFINRGHGINEVVKATRLLKEAGYKVCYHLMLNLPKSDPKKDLECFKIVFSDERFKPDMIKIYPTVVVKGTKLYEMWKKGEYRVYSEEELKDLLEKIFKILPPWVRVMRLQRDIPSTAAEAGVFQSLRDLFESREIRFREIGHKHKKFGVPIRPEKIEIEVIEYKASGGKEFFIQAVDKEYDALYGICRLRIGKSWLFEYPYIRELHVYGTAIPIGSEGKIQHKGIGKKLLQEAENIAKSYYDEILVISGIGVREYYKKLGYNRFYWYMKKKI